MLYANASRRPEMSDDDELRRQVQESMNNAPAPAPGDLRSVERGARKFRTRRVLFGSTTAVVVLAAVVAPLALLSPLGGKGRPPIGSVSAGATGDGFFSFIRIAIPPTEGAYYYEGAYGYVRITTAASDEVFFKELTNYLLPMFSQDMDLPPGAYLIESYVRPCDGNCGLLDPPTERCSTGFQIQTGKAATATITYKAGLGCSISVGQRLASPAVDLPDVAEVVCDDSGAHVMTPEAKPQLDGVHFQLDNQTIKQ